MLVALIFVTLTSVWSGKRVYAAEGFTVRLEFQDIKQGRIGVISILDTSFSRATASIMNREYDCYPVRQGGSCPIAVPMDQPPQDYPLVLTVTQPDGSTVTRSLSITIAKGSFITERLFLPGNLEWLLRDDVQADEDLRFWNVYSIVTPIRYWEGPFTVPLLGNAGTPFGTFRTYNDKVPRRHSGQDVQTKQGQPVLAAANGRVALSRSLNIHGNTIIIDHGWGVYTSYAHLSTRYVVLGQFVTKGDVIGLVGSTGRSTGPHLHWEVAVNGIVVDPVAFGINGLPQ